MLVDSGIACPRAADVNLDERIDVSDPVAILNGLFLGGSASRRSRTYSAMDQGGFREAPFLPKRTMAILARLSEKGGLVILKLKSKPARLEEAGT